MARNRTVKGIVVKDCTTAQYFQIYRARSTEEQVKAAIDLNILDEEHYRRVLTALKTPRQ